MIYIKAILIQKQGKINNGINDGINIGINNGMVV